MGKQTRTEQTEEDVGREYMTRKDKNRPEQIEADQTYS